MYRSSFGWINEGADCKKYINEKVEKMEKWILETKKADFNRIAHMFRISPVLARIMVNRGVNTEEEIKKYLHGTIENMYSPYLLKDMELAADIIENAIKGKEKIAIASDFDVDGIFSGMILHTGLQKIGGDVFIDAPDRVREGYGLNQRIVEDAKEKGATLIITCDNGIAALEPIAYAKDLGMKVIVTDHHEVPFEEDENGERTYLRSRADAIINHKQIECQYPFKKLCGAAVVYKVIQVLYERFSIPVENLHKLLEFTAIATIADVMELVDENRIIVRYGLELLRKTNNVGLNALIEVNQLQKENISAYHIGFVLGPCFNAAGRLQTVQIALELLQCQEKDKAEQLARELKTLNDSRKEMTLEGVEQAVEIVTSTEIQRDKILLIRLKGTHESLVGIIAGRIRELFHKPVIVFTDAKEGIKGSGRSIEAYNMFEGLIKCKHLLEKFGGHPMAAGLSLREENLPLLRKQLNEQAQLQERDFIPIIRIDVPMPIGYITQEFIGQLEWLEPFGQGNRKPLFAEQSFHILGGQIIGKNKNVFKCKVKNKENDTIEAIYFGDTEALFIFMEEEFGKEEVDKMLKGQNNAIDIAFTYYPTINEFRGNKTLQIVIQNYCTIKK